MIGKNKELQRQIGNFGKGIRVKGSQGKGSWKLKCFSPLLENPLHSLALASYREAIRVFYFKLLKG